jgi:hypothetical protein
VFTAGQGLADDPAIRERNSEGRVRATTYWEAAEWLAGFATAADKGDQHKRRKNRREAQRVLQNVREEPSLPEPGTESAERPTKQSAP